MGTHQDIFARPLQDMLETRNLSYLQSWLDMYRALRYQVGQSFRKVVGEPDTDSDNSLEVSCNTLDMDEYLVEDSDEERKALHEAMGEAELTPPSSSKVEKLRNLWKSWG